MTTETKPAGKAERFPYLPIAPNAKTTLGELEDLLADNIDALDMEFQKKMLSHLKPSVIPYDYRTPALQNEFARDILRDLLRFVRDGA